MKLSREIFMLYAITDDRWRDATVFYDQVEAALRGGVTCLQFRDKLHGRNEVKAHARIVRALCDRYAIPFIMNDDVELALEIGADGVHAGQRDMSIERARTIIGDNRMIGASAQSAEQALCSQNQGADYLGAGSVFPTMTKLDAKNISKECLKQITSSVSIPVVAIGGIKAQNITLLAGTGIAGIATVSAIFHETDIYRACQKLRVLSSAVVDKGSSFQCSGKKRYTEIDDLEE